MLPPHFNGHARGYTEHAERLSAAQRRADEAQHAAITATLDALEEQRLDLDAARAADEASSAPVRP